MAKVDPVAIVSNWIAYLGNYGSHCIPSLYREGVKQEVFIPDQENTFLVSPPAGTEKLYLLASPERLEKLENLVTSFIQAPDDIAARSAVLKEIKKLRRQHSALTQATETGVPIAGTIITRSLLPSRLQATQVATDGFYSRIIRIKHD